LASSFLIAQAFINFVFVLEEFMGIALPLAALASEAIAPVDTYKH